MSSVYDQIALKLLRSGNCLGVLAGGLCESQTVRAILSQFSKQKALALIIVLSSGGEDGNAGTVITGETGNETRNKIYATGGVVSVTTRVLLSDLLVRRLDPALIDLLVISKMHAIASPETSNEAFIVRLFREASGRGLFVGLSEKPHAVVSQKLDTYVSSFHLSEVIVIPRFHELVKQHLDALPPVEVLQHESLLSPSQADIQNSLLSIVEASMEEIRKSGCEIINNSATLMSNSGKELYLLRRNLEPVWMKLSWNARQIISDLSVIRKLLVALVKYHSVCFRTLLVQEQHSGSKSSSPWWFSESALKVVKLSKDRLLEAPTDWLLLENILTPSSPALKKVRRQEEEKKVLIVCSDDLSAKQFSEFLNEGSEKALLEAQLYLEPDRVEVKQKIDSLEVVPIFCRDFQVSANLEKSDLLSTDISLYNPSVIVLTSPSLTAVRVIEMFRSLNQNNNLETIHIISHPESVIEASFASLIERENKAFDDLIKGKRMVTFHSKDQLHTDRKVAVSSATSRKGGSRRVRELITERILVDVRELRSALPFVLHKKRVELVPCTLAIGDYVISRDIAVERKSVTGNDLQQSLISGRLYKQLVNLTHAFAWPVLLLEFSTGKLFQLQSNQESFEINPSSLIAQIAAIIMHFPSVRLVWSPSFAFSANIFIKLKAGREQPRPPPSSDEGEKTVRAIEFLKACPGITAANLPLVLKRVRSVKELVLLDHLEMIQVLGKRDAYLFQKFINYQF